MFGIVLFKVLSVVSEVGVDTRVLRVDGAVLVLGTWDTDKLGLKCGDGLCV